MWNGSQVQHAPGGEISQITQQKHARSGDPPCDYPEQGVLKAAVTGQAQLIKSDTAAQPHPCQHRGDVQRNTEESYPERLLVPIGGCPTVHPTEKVELLQKGPNC